MRVGRILFAASLFLSAASAAATEPRPLALGVGGQAQIGYLGIKK
jgi:hypothetical protein